MAKGNVEALQKDNHVFEQALTLFMRLNYQDEQHDEEVVNQYMINPIFKFCTMNNNK